MKTELQHLTLMHNLKTLIEQVPKTVLMLLMIKEVMYHLIDL